MGEQKAQKPCLTRGWEPPPTLGTAGFPPQNTPSFPRPEEKCKGPVEQAPSFMLPCTSRGRVPYGATLTGISLQA